MAERSLLDEAKERYLGDFARLEADAPARRGSWTGALRREALDRFAAARVSVVLLLIAAAGTFALSAAESFAVGLIASICLGFGSGGETDIVPYLIARHFGLRSLSTLYGFNGTAWGLAGIAGPFLLGRAFDETGSYALAMTQLGVITLVAAALMLTFPQLSPAKAER